VTRIHPCGCFELFADGRLIGWLTNEKGGPASGVVRVNGSGAETIRPKWRWPVWQRGESPRRGGFSLRLRLDSGDRVEVIHGVTGQPVPGVVCRAADPHWRPRVAVVAPAKQEAPYLLEWIAYHRALGVEQFVIGDNGGSDFTSELLLALDAAGLIVRLDWRREVAFQLRFSVAAIELLCGKADVCALVDVDELLRPLGERDDIPAAIAEIFARPETSAAALNWAIYGSGGRTEPGEGLVTERFVDRAPDDDALHRLVKSLVRPERFAGMVNPHVVRLAAGEYVDDRGVPAQWERTPASLSARSWDRLRVDHYVVKSRREFGTKVRRGRATVAPGVDDRDESFFVRRDRNEVSDPMPAAFVRRTRHEMERMRERLEPFVTPDGPMAKWLGAAIADPH
jgi:hypothetical protein